VRCEQWAHPVELVPNEVGRVPAKVRTCRLSGFRALLRHVRWFSAPPRLENWPDQGLTLGNDASRFHTVVPSLRRGTPERAQHAARTRHLARPAMPPPAESRSTTARVSHFSVQHAKAQIVHLYGVDFEEIE
jgi:hypothetical protein